MKPTEVKRFKKLYQRHLGLLKLQGKSPKTIDAYSRAVRRISEHFDCCPDQLTPEQLETYFEELVDSHFWSTVKIDRLGLQFYWRYVLKLDWQWVNVIGVKSFPLTIGAADHLIYQIVSSSLVHVPT